MIRRASTRAGAAERSRVPWIAAAVALVCLSASLVHAQSAPVGSGSWAMPALHRVLVATETEPGVDVAAMGGYGYTEDVLGSHDTHHRAMGSVALAGRPTSWLTIAGRLDGRFDAHHLPSLDDQSAVGEGRLALRGDFGVGSGVALGLAAIAFVPGADAPSLVLDAITVDLRGLVSWTPEGLPLTFALDAGVRFDRSARAVQRPVPYAPTDLVSLGLSDSDQVLLGLGAVGRIDETELFGEVSADLLVERGLAASPVRLAAGARVPIVSRLLSFYVALEAGVGGRIAVDPAGTLVPVEPRFAATLGLVLSPRSAPPAPVVEEVAPPPLEARGRILDPSGTPIAGARVHPAGAAEPFAITDSEGAYVLPGIDPSTPLEVEAEGYVAQSVGGASSEVVLERALPEGALRGLVRSLTGRSITAHVTVAPGGATAETDADGVFELALPPGHYEVTIEARGHVAQHREVDVEVGGVTVLNVDLRGGRR